MSVPACACVSLARAGENMQENRYSVSPFLVARGREREIENSKSIGIFHRKARKTTFQRRDKYFFCMYCINNDLMFTCAYMFSEISDL